MPSAVTNDSGNRARLTVEATGVNGGVNWSASVLDNSATLGGFGETDGRLTVTMGPVTVISDLNKSYDFGANSPARYFPRSYGTSFLSLGPGSYTATGTFSTSGVVGTASLSFGFTVPSPPTPAPVFSDNTVASSASIGVAYSDGVSASNSPSYSVVSGALPTGLTLNTSTGAITGTPTVNGAFTFVIRASNAGGSVDTGTLTITVTSAARVWNGTAFVPGLANVWNGTAFVSGILKVWDGTNWVNTN